jgi:ribosome-associated translation inhibitor RaiA
MTSIPRLDPENITIQITGAVSQSARDHAVEKVKALAQLSHEPILHARISLDAGGRPGIVPASAAVSLDVNGTPVRAHAEGTTLLEAIDLLQARLRTRLLRHEDRPRRSQPVRLGPSARPEGEQKA